MQGSRPSFDPVRREGRRAHGHADEAGRTGDTGDEGATGGVAGDDDFHGGVAPIEAESTHLDLFAVASVTGLRKDGLRVSRQIGLSRSDEEGGTNRQYPDSGFGFHVVEIVSDRQGGGNGGAELCFEFGRRKQ